MNLEESAGLEEEFYEYDQVNSDCYSVINTQL